jgi:hypothetical protein
MYNLREIDDHYLYNSNIMLESQDSYLYKTIAVFGICLLAVQTFLFLQVNESNKLLFEKEKDEEV